MSTKPSAIDIDGNIRLVAPSFISASARGNMQVHAGFQNSYLKLRTPVLNALQAEIGSHLFITGHSLGGAIATLMAYDVAINRRNDFASITLIVSGAPRVGNAAFANSFVQAVPDNLRIVVNHDPVPAVPYVNGLYRHAGRLLVIGAQDGVLVKHQDMDVHVNALEFRFHKNDLYFDAVRMLRDRTPNSPALRPNGNAWALDAAREEVNLAAQPRPGGIRARLSN